MTGQTLGHYKIESRLGQGGMGVVYRARDTHLDRPVAVKVLPAEAVADPERKRRFIQEAKAASALNNPNIVTIYDVASAGGVDYIAMEYIDGRTLDAAIGHKGLKLSEALAVAIQVADALTKAHAAGIVHRDLKPANVMITRDGLVKVLDFGLAKLTERSQDDQDATVDERQSPKTEDGALMGTAAYMSPEQAQGHAVDARSDIFSFGSVLYELLTGARAFPGDNKISTLSAILNRDPAPVTEKNAGLPHEVERIISRCLRKDPARRFQLMDEVRLALLDLKEDSESGRVAAPLSPVQTSSAKWKWIAAVGVVLVAAAIAVAVRSRPNAHPGKQPLQLTRVTSDPGLTTNPALSADGKMLAYASDRGGDDLNIWVQHLSGGAPIRITSDRANESDPVFSPDGGKIAYRSSRDGGGIYVVPVLGGESQLIVKSGLNPRFSPDGAFIAYDVGALGAASGTTRRKAFVVPASGGTPRELVPHFFSAAMPLWTPDGKHAVLLGRDVAQSPPSWWAVPVAGGAPVEMGLKRPPQPQRFSAAPVAPEAWSPDGKHIIYAATSGDSINLWRVPVNPGTLKISGDPEQLTFGTGIESDPSVASDGALALASGAFSADLWMYPVDANQGKVTGNIQRVTEDAAVDERAMISANGSRIVFISDRSGKQQVWTRDLVTGKERMLSNEENSAYWPTISGDGTKVTYQGRGGIKYVGSEGGVPEVVSDIQNSNWDLSTDGTTGLVGGGAVRGSGAPVFAYYLSKPEAPIALQHTSEQLLSPKFSADMKWIVLHTRNTELTRRIYVAPFRPGSPLPQPEWVPISDGKALDRDPGWSPDGKLIYWLTDRDGFRCIAARRVDGVTKRPQGEMFYVVHFHSARRNMLPFTNTGAVAPSIAQGKMIFALGERTGNIWLTKLR